MIPTFGAHSAYNGNADKSNTTLKFWWPSASSAGPVAEPAVEPVAEPIAEAAAPPVGEHPSKQAAFPIECSPSPIHPILAPRSSPDNQISSSTFNSSLTSLSSADSQSEVDEEGETTPSPRPHPLNNLIAELLRRFKAHYAEDTLSQETTMTSYDDNTNITRMDDNWRKTIFGNRPRNRPPATPPPQQLNNLSPEEQARNTKLKENLTSHDPILALFERHCLADWPQKDRVEDQKPKDGLVIKRDGIPVGSNTGKKRSFNEGESSKSKQDKVTPTPSDQLFRACQSLASHGVTSYL